MLEFLKNPSLVLLFSYYILMAILMMLSVILLSMKMILLSTLNVIRHLICDNSLNWLLNLNLTYVTLWTGAGSGLLISMLEKLNQFHLTGLKALLLLMWKLIGLFLRKSHLLIWWEWLSLLNWIETYIISIAMTAPKKIRALICPMKFLSPEVALYLYKYSIRSCLEYCCHAWAGAPSCYSELLNKL